MLEILLEFLLFEYLILCFVCYVDLQFSVMSFFFMAYGLELKLWVIGILVINLFG